jgi:8-oxo-dGTP pyrophosphatase MutT (NUDIX family)
VSEPLVALLRHPTVERIAAALSRRPGVVAEVEEGVRAAAVALIVSAGEDGDPELLFIKRAERQGDPWSGHVAFPGGRHDPGDASLEATAVRETYEETGVDLRRDGVVLGTLDDLYPRTPTLPPVVVRPFVAALAPRAALSLSDECADAFWVPLATLQAPDAAHESVVLVRGERWRVASYRHGEHVIWGMTERILQQFLATLRDVP